MQQLQIPTIVPVMTIPGAVLFPQTVMPIYIFEQRYRRMLQDTLAGARIFAVAARTPENIHFDAQANALNTIAGLGLIRACRTNPDGSAQLILQGLARVRLSEFNQQEQPYLQAHAEQIISQGDNSAEHLQQIRTGVMDLVRQHAAINATIPNEVVEYLDAIAYTEAALDMAIYTLCTSSTVKQELLETTDLFARFSRFEQHMQAQLTSN